MKVTFKKVLNDNQKAVMALRLVKKYSEISIDPEEFEKVLDAAISEIETLTEMIESHLDDIENE